MIKPARNINYFKAFNEDYRVGGSLHGLENAALRAMVILQAYVNTIGMVGEQSGKGYSDRDLSLMLGLNARTVKKALLELSNKELIRVEDNGMIYLRHFLFDQTDRDPSGDKAGAKSGAIQKAQVIKQIKATLVEAELDLVARMNQLYADAKYIVRGDGRIAEVASGEIISMEQLKLAVEQKETKDESQS